MDSYQKLEIEWAEFNNLNPENMVVCSSGTAALHLALEALELPLGSKVVVPDFTMIACARACTLAGLEPIFVDCNRENLLMVTEWPDRWDIPDDPINNESVRAVMAVHIYGRQCDMVELEEIANVRPSESFYIIEDLAEAHGVKPDPSTDAACWSFYRNKIVAGEEGGAVYFKDKLAAERARELRCLGFTNEHDFLHIPRGHNYRMSNAHAELILHNLDHYATNFRRRADFFARCDELIRPEYRMPPRQANWVYDFRVPEAKQIPIYEQLREKGVGVRLGFKPMTTQPEYQCSSVGPEAFKASEEILYLQFPATDHWGPVMERVFDLINNE